MHLYYFCLTRGELLPFARAWLTRTSPLRDLISTNKCYDSSYLQTGEKIVPPCLGNLSTCFDLCRIISLEKYTKKIRLGQLTMCEDKQTGLGLFGHRESCWNFLGPSEAYCSLQFRLKLVLDFFCPCGGIYFCFFLTSSTT